MTLKQVKEIAKVNGLKVGNMKKENIIRAIQRAEGNNDCFGSANAGICDQFNCLWREDCLK
ncbi:MAG: SAP domain-containing protein [Thermodesulfovibrio sp. RBG_19FT_COMBO_42_12]|nr:MAG: SAP domain-containing protein [Thermodesulfovibrio sp. RBG_19FT_COMBO_42_12]